MFKVKILRFLNAYVYFFFEQAIGSLSPLKTIMTHTVTYRLASVGILGKERESGVGKLGWHGNFDTGFERNTAIS